MKQGSFEISPSFHHARQEFGATWIKGRIESYRDAQTHRSRSQVRIGSR